MSNKIDVALRSVSKTVTIKIIFFILLAHGRGSYSCLEVSFIFKRLIEFYAYDVYIPLLLIVLISFIGLFIDYNSTAR